MIFLINCYPDLPDSQLRSKLGTAGFSAELADVATGRLSGGQKARLLLFLATLDAPHILILDEPTNHLDIESRDALVMALNSYQGAVILVSHDMHLVQTVADRLWLVKDGRVTDYDGDIASYSAAILATRTQKKQDKDRPKPQKQAAERFNLARAEKALRKLEDKLQETEQKKADLEAEMASAEFYDKKERAVIDQKTALLAEITAAINELESEWLERSSEIEDHRSQHQS